MGGKRSSISARISEQLRARIDAMHARFRTTDAAILHDALSALVDYVEARGRYEWPFRIEFDDDAAEHLKWKAAETANDASRTALRTLIDDAPNQPGSPQAVPESPPIEQESRAKLRHGGSRRNKKPGA